MGKESALMLEMTECLVCGNPNYEVHHIFFGERNRSLSDAYKFVLPLCAEHHRGQMSPHQDRKIDLAYKRSAQRVFEKEHSREEFIKLFGKSYL